VVVSVVLVVLAVTYRHGVARRLHVASGQLALMILAVVAVAIVIVVLPAAVDHQPVHNPLASTFQGIFHSEAKVESAQDRLNLASSVEAVIPQHLFIGSGLGVQFQYFETGTQMWTTIAYAHNIVLDLWVRLGLIGLVLFVLALVASIVGGMQVWRRHPEPMTAAFALALVAVLAGLMATALLEPLIDEYRFATLLGVSIGMLRAAVTSMGEWRGRPSWRLEASHLKAAAGGGKWS